MDIVKITFRGAYITEMPVPGKEREWAYICVSRVPILPLSTIFQMDVEAVLTVIFCVFHFIFSIKLYTTYTCFVVGSELLFVSGLCPFLISTSVVYNAYCRARLLLFTIEYFILLQTLIPLIT